MKINGAAFAAAHSLVDLVPEQTGVQSSHFVRLIGKEGKATMRLSGIISAAAEMKAVGDIRAFFDRKILRTFVSKVKKDADITIEPVEGGVQLKSGNSTVVVAQPSDSAKIAYGAWKKAAGKDVVFDRGLITMLNKHASVIEAHLSLVQLVKGWGAVAGDGTMLSACLDTTVGANCPLPKMLLDLVPASAEKLWIEETGAALIQGSAWLHQPVPVADKSYPLEKMKDVLNKARVAKPFLKISSDALSEAVGHLSSFAWGGTSYGVLVESKQKNVSLRLDTPIVKTALTVPGLYTGTEQWQWPLEKVETWVSFIAKLGSDITIEAGKAEFFHFFRCKVEKRDYILAVVQN